MAQLSDSAADAKLGPAATPTESKSFVKFSRNEKHVNFNWDVHNTIESTIEDRQVLS